MFKWLNHYLDHEIYLKNKEQKLKYKLMLNPGNKRLLKKLNRIAIEQEQHQLRLRKTKELRASNLHSFDQGDPVEHTLNRIRTNQRTMINIQKTNTLRSNRQAQSNSYNSSSRANTKSGRQTTKTSRSTGYKKD